MWRGREVPFVGPDQRALVTLTLATSADENNIDSIRTFSELTEEFSTEIRITEYYLLDVLCKSYGELPHSEAHELASKIRIGLNMAGSKATLLAAGIALLSTGVTLQLPESQEDTRDVWNAHLSVELAFTECIEDPTAEKGWIESATLEDDIVPYPDGDITFTVDAGT